MHTHRGSPGASNKAKWTECTGLENGAGAQLGDPGHSRGLSPAATLWSFREPCGRKSPSALGQTWGKILAL